PMTRFPIKPRASPSSRTRGYGSLSYLSSWLEQRRKDGITVGTGISAEAVPTLTRPFRRPAAGISIAP
ncbi:MAG: hypothetical protein WCD29_09340, partial [Pseudolabrys sp.]